MSIKKYAFLVPLALGLGSCGDGDEDKTDPPAKIWPSSLSPTCAKAYREFADRVWEAKRCQVDSDCAFQHIYGSPILAHYEGHCIAGFYHNKNVDPSQPDASGKSFQDLAQEAASCIFSGTCAALPETSRCWQGRCWQKFKLPYEGTQETCWANAPKNDCTMCLCGVGPASSKSCFDDAACGEVFECLRLASCLANYGSACKPPFPSPCQKKYSALSGAQKDRLNNVVHGRNGAGCYARCGPPEKK